MEDDGGVAHSTDLVESVTVVLLGGRTTAREVGYQRFVEELDGDHNVVICGNGVFGGDLGDHVVGEGGGVARRPCGCACPLPGIVEAVLGKGGAWMKKST